MDQASQEPAGLPLALEAEQLCELLARLDVTTLPELPAVFPGNGPHVQPIFRGPNAELVAVHWSRGHSTPIGTLGSSTMAIRPIAGELELLSFTSSEGGKPELVGVQTIGPMQLAGIPSGALHALRARGEVVTLHLCSPPVVWREQLEVTRS